MSGKARGGGGRGASSSSTAPSHIATGNQFAALLLDVDDDPDEPPREEHRDEAPEASEPEKGDDRVGESEGGEARSELRPSTTTSTSISTTTSTSRPPPPLLRRPLFFLDLEMTGLDPDVDTILEIAVIATDGEDLDRRVVGPSLAITTTRERLETMNAWCVEHHGRSGLTERCLDPSRSVPLDVAEKRVCEFFERHRPPPRERRRGNGGGKEEAERDGDEGGEARKPSQLVQDKAVLAGNSIHTDLSFIRKHMPRLASLCSYRLVDVSCLAELARRWSPAAFYSAPEKRNAHEALKDVEDSIEELKYYRRVLFKTGSEVSRAVARHGGPRRGG